MTPLDLILWALAVAAAVVIVGCAVMLVGAGLLALRENQHLGRRPDTPDTRGK